MQFFKSIVLLSFLLLPQMVTLAAPSIGLGYTPKYPANFKHFDYVNPDAPKGGKIILSGFGDFDSFNPYILKGVAVDGLTDLIFETLMVQSTDEPYSLYGHIANDIKLAKNKLSVTFKLNPLARFSDGSPVLAKDVKISFDTIKKYFNHGNSLSSVNIYYNRSFYCIFKRKDTKILLNRNLYIRYTAFI